MEIERKWRLPAPPPDLGEQPTELVEQGYVALDPDGTEVRVRHKGPKHLLTIKSGPALVRVEEELAISPERFAALWALTEGRRVTKTRTRVPLEADLVAEVDVYQDALWGLVTAEVEFASEDASAAFTAPAWLGTEVTGDGAYANQTLAVRGIPT